MRRPSNRIAPLAAAATLLLLAIAPGAFPGGVARAADRGLVVVAQARYVAFPAQRRVHVTIDAVATSYTPNPVDGLAYYPDVTIPVQPGATHVAATCGRAVPLGLGRSRQSRLRERHGHLRPGCLLRGELSLPAELRPARPRRCAGSQPAHQPEHRRVPGVGVREQRRAGRERDRHPAGWLPPGRPGRCPGRVHGREWRDRALDHVAAGPVQLLRLPFGRSARRLPRHAGDGPGRRQARATPGARLAGRSRVGNDDGRPDDRWAPSSPEAHRPHLPHCHFGQAGGRGGRDQPAW